jgi:hypothetical protein
MWFTGINYYKLAVEKDRESIFTITTIWKPGLKTPSLLWHRIDTRPEGTLLCVLAEGKRPKVFYVL